jgi:hypothetical protein
MMSCIEIMYNQIPIHLFFIGSVKINKSFILCLEHWVKVIKHIPKKKFGGLNVMNWL